MIIVSIDDMNRFKKKKKGRKIRPIKNTWYDCLINHIPEPIRSSVGCFNGKIFLRQIHLNKLSGTGQKLNKPRKENIKKPFISNEN